MPAAIDVMARLPMRVARPVMLQHVYAHPEKELARLHTEGRLLRIAHGTYVLRPDTESPGWKPVLEVAAMAYATAAYPGQTVVLYGLSAARWLHAIPRALSLAIVAAPRQHRPVDLQPRGRILFTLRNIDELDTMPTATPLGPMRITTPEQTLIDIVPHLGVEGTNSGAEAACRDLLPQVTIKRLRRLMERQTPTRQARVIRLLKAEGLL